MLQDALVELSLCPVKAGGFGQAGVLGDDALEMPSDAAMRSWESWAANFRRKTSLILRIPPAQRTH